MKRYSPSPESAAAHAAKVTMFEQEEQERLARKQAPTQEISSEEEAAREQEKRVLMLRWNREVGTSNFYALAFDGSERSMEQFAIAEELQVKDAQLVFPANRKFKETYDSLQKYNDTADTAKSDIEIRSAVEKRLASNAASVKSSFGSTAEWADNILHEQQEGIFSSMPEEELFERYKGFAVAALEQDDIKAFLACINAGSLTKDAEIASLVDVKMRAYEPSDDPHDQAVFDELKNDFCIERPRAT